MSILRNYAKFRKKGVRRGIKDQNARPAESEARHRRLAARLASMRAKRAKIKDMDTDFPL